MLAAATMIAGAGLAVIVQVRRDGYKNTPIIPGQKWHVHDSDRPYPPEVVPGATPGAPPSDAIVLFDGTDTSHWIQGEPGPTATNLQPTKWKAIDGALVVNPGTGSISTKETFGDCQLHIEWQEDETIKGSGQGRGNSGVFLMRKFEIQVLDSYKSATYADGQAGALYGQWPPMVNPIRKPGEWQTYDVIFEAPKFDGDKLVSPAYVTLFFNGVMVHNHQKLNGPTAHQAVAPYTKMPAEDRISLQDHGPRQPLRFRNIWVRRIKGYDQP